MSRKRASVRRLKSGLTALEERFVAEYCVDFIGSAALRRAGSQARYIDQQAYEMLRKPHIVEAISAQVAKTNEKAIVNKQWIMTELVLQYRAASAAAAAGNTAERRVALQALEKLGQHVDVNAFRQQIGVGNLDGSNFDFSGLNDDELDDLERLISKAALTSGGSGGEGETAH